MFKLWLVAQNIIRQLIISQCIYRYNNKYNILYFQLLLLWLEGPCLMQVMFLQEIQEQGIMDLFVMMTLVMQM
jgi:hypothetical protein